MSTNAPGNNTPAKKTTAATRENHEHRENGASGVELRTAHDDNTTKQSWLGTDEVRRGSNLSWGAVFGGVVTFFALLLLLSMIPAALGLGGATGTTLGIWSVVILALAMAGGGYVAGALAGRGGLFHGFLTWATSMLATLLLVGWLGSSILGAVGSGLSSALSGVTNAATAAAQQSDVTGEQAANAAQNAAEQARQNIDPAQVQQQAQEAAQNVQQGAAQAADTASSGIWWTFAGSLIGAILAALTGVAGARSVANKRREYVTTRVNA